MWPYVAIFYRYHGLAVRCVPWVDCDVERTVAPGLIEILPAVFSPMTYIYGSDSAGREKCLFYVFFSKK